MFRNIPGCSGMFHVPAFVNAPPRSALWAEIRVIIQMIVTENDNLVPGTFSLFKFKKVQGTRL